MADLLLLVVLMYSFHEIEAQARVPPKLTVNPPVITVADSVTLNCTTSAAVPQCDFYIASQKLSKGSSCVQTLTGSELLKIAHKSLPAEVEVRCVYTVQVYTVSHTSPDSQPSTITINNLHPPKLTVSLLMITVADSVTLNCTTSAAGPQCDFYIASQKLSKGSSCVQTLTGSELLKITHKSLPAEVEVRCSYTVQVYSDKHTSPDSQPSTITINNLHPPKLTVNPPLITVADSVTLNCTTSAAGPQCDFYIVSQKLSKGSSCVQTLTGSELLKITHKSLPAEVEVRCSYTVQVYSDKHTSPDSQPSTIIINNLHPPKLTVNPPVITVADSVTLNCTTSAAGPQCDFYIASQKLSEGSSCVQTLTGSELLKNAQKCLPAEVEVRCSYTVQVYSDKHTSPDSQPSIITINNLRPPELTVNPPLITETDSVTLSCQTHAAVSQCDFYIASQKLSKGSSCVQTLTATELLKIAQKCLPAEVEVRCSYTVQVYSDKHTSPDSEPSTIIINTHRPELTVNPQMITETDSVTVNCQTPSSLSVTQCFLHFMRRQKSTSISCQQTLTGTELLFMAQQSSPAEVKVTCFYMSPYKGGQYQSPHSNISSISIQIPFARKILPVFATSFGVIVGVISLTVAFVCVKRRNGDFSITRKTDQEGSLPRNDNEAFNMISLVPVEDPPTESGSVLLAGSDQPNREESQTENSSVCQMYSTIPEEPGERSLRKADVAYSTLQLH
ncbi:unnamed protein product [Oreochromis niloticus]|nr:unnamed protein product [Mustela putorius furo]